MVNSLNKDINYLSIKIIQSGDIIRIKISKENLRKEFHDIYSSLLKDLKLKQKDTYLSNDEGKMIGVLDLNSSLEEIIQKFGLKLKLYYEKVI
ncbi:MAG: hypothetical protein ACFE9S_10185 [Candidatus Hermodarchaeota archaeon]